MVFLKQGGNEVRSNQLVSKFEKILFIYYFVIACSKRVVANLTCILVTVSKD